MLVWQYDDEVINRLVEQRFRGRGISRLSFGILHPISDLSASLITQSSFPIVNGNVPVPIAGNLQA